MLVGRPDIIDKLQDLKDELGWKPFAEIDNEYLVKKFMDLIELLKDEFKQQKVKTGV